MDVSCIVLAGGKSTRLGRNKIVEVLGNKSLLERVVSRLSSLKSEIIVVAAKDSSLPELTNYPDLKVVTDIFPGKGSLGGIYSGLMASASPYSLVVACDMPFLNLDLLCYLTGLTEGYDAVVPKINDMVEPLHAVYSRKCIPTMKGLIKEGRLSLLIFLALVNVRYVTAAEINRLDGKHLSFFNINTEADLTAGKELVGKEGTHD